MRERRAPGLRWKWAGATGAWLALTLAGASAQATPRVLSLDQCADQYVLALSPREAVVGLSTRADDADSRLRGLARGLPLSRGGLEAVLAARPQVVVRYWGGDPRLVAALRKRGVEVVTIDEAADFAEIRANVRRVAAGLGRDEAGEALIAGMDARLARSRGAWGGKRAIYLTPGGATAGPLTLVDEVMRAAGLRNATTQPGYGAVSLEALALDPPPAVVLAFFDTFQLAGDSWGPGSHRIMRRLVSDRAIASMPGATVSCPTWFAGEAVEILAKAARR